LCGGEFPVENELGASVNPKNFILGPISTHLKREIKGRGSWGIYGGAPALIFLIEGVVGSCKAKQSHADLAFIMRSQQKKGARKEHGIWAGKGKGGDQGKKDERNSTRGGVPYAFWTKEASKR